MSDTQFIDIFTDGSCIPNPGYGGWGAVIFFPDETRQLRGRSPHLVSNNTMELTAVLKALCEIQGRQGTLRIFSDSRYVVDGVTLHREEWRTEQWQRWNRDLKKLVPICDALLWKELDDLLQELKNPIEWKYVKAHSGNLGNDLADRLSREPLL